MEPSGPLGSVGHRRGFPTLGDDPACPPVGRHGWPCPNGSYLVDPASSHMLVSKIKPCMSKYKQLYGETANGSLNQL
jgi:hypothetical protein